MLCGSLHGSIWCCQLLYDSDITKGVILFLLLKALSCTLKLIYVVPWGLSFFDPALRSYSASFVDVQRGSAQRVTLFNPKTSPLLVKYFIIHDTRVTFLVSMYTIPNWWEVGPSENVCESCFALIMLLGFQNEVLGFAISARGISSILWTVNTIIQSSPGMTWVRCEHFIPVITLQACLER